MDSISEKLSSQQPEGIKTVSPPVAPPKHLDVSVSEILNTTPTISSSCTTDRNEKFSEPFSPPPTRPCFSSNVTGMSDLSVSVEKSPNIRMNNSCNVSFQRVQDGSSDQAIKTEDEVEDEDPLEDDILSPQYSPLTPVKLKVMDYVTPFRDVRRHVRFPPPGASSVVRKALNFDGPELEDTT